MRSAADHVPEAIDSETHHEAGATIAKEKQAKEEVTASTIAQQKRAVDHVHEAIDIDTP